MSILCGACSFPVAPEAWNREDGARCPGCGQTVFAAVFPAIERSNAGAVPEKIEESSESSCFFHPQSRAVIPCSGCGRFLCNLCDISIDGTHLCPACFQSGVRSKKLETLETVRSMHDTMALVLSTFPVLLFWPALITAPMALYIVIRRWRTPLSIVPRTRIRFVLAALFALVEISAFVIFIWVVIQMPKPSVVSR
jgi:DNA-directed RNA polymerase subunit RPC12/RpoP